MALPWTFANQATPQMVELDQNFAAVGAVGVVPCTVTGTNALTFTPALNTPTISAYANFMIVSGIAANSNSGLTTAQVGALASLNVYVDGSGGPVQATTGSIVAGNAIRLMYDSALNTGAGGFHLLGNGSGGAVVGTTATFSGLVSLGAMLQLSRTNAITAHSGGGQASAVLLTTVINRVTVVAAGGDSVKLQPTVAGEFQVVINAAAANAMNVFPSSGEIINALAADTAISVVANKTIVFWCAVAGTWNSLLTA